MRTLLHALVVSFFLFCYSLVTIGQSASSWSIDYSKPKVFIQNQGQFDQPAQLIHVSDVEFACDASSQNYFFTKTGLVIELSSKSRAIKSEEEKELRAERKTQPFNSLKEWQDFENAGHRIDFNRDVLETEWIGANPDVELIAEDANYATHSYTYYDENRNVKALDNLKAYNKLTYKNLYPNIDVVYEFHPDGGIKYSVIVHPGGDLSQVKLKYSKDAVLYPDGTIHTTTILGEIIDHAPVTFYEGNTHQIIQSSYVLDNNIISFFVGDFDPTKTLVIDPWVQTPTFATNWDCVWECEKDAAGNAYIIGGVMPLQLLKYNPAGVLQWTYNTPYDTTMWLGAFATDNAGNSYVTNGSTAMIQRITTAGTLSWNNSSPGGLFTSTELWNISFNCDQTKLVIGGTGGFLPPLPYVYDINMATGNVITSVQVTGSQLFPGPHEVRAIVATENEKYYWMTHDSIGYISEDLVLCPTSTGTPFHISTGYGLDYKNENWRYNNSGVEALAYYDGFVYVNRGNQVHKRDFNTGAIIASAPIPGGGFAGVFFGGNQVQNSGISVDQCGNVFVGSKNQIVQYDQNLVQIATFPTTFNVYDVEVTSGGSVIACGSTGTSGSASRTGSVQSFDPGACAPVSMICCNPFVCPVDPLCTSDAPVSLAADNPGGTWSISPATPGFNTATGVINPALTAPGTYTVTYTLICGSEDVILEISDCAAMVVCEETNGTFTVSGGSPGFTWASQQMISVGCVPGFGSCAGLFSFTDAAPPTLQWVNFGTGTNVTIPGGANPVQITDGNGTILVFDPNTIGSCSVACDPTITPAGPFCTTDAAVNLAAVEPGGTWSGTGITNPTTGAFNPTTAGPGSHVITYTLLCGSSDTETIVVNAATTPMFNPVAAICSGEPLAALPTTSTNGVTGTWSPALNNTATTLYTFTPTAGLCASTTTLTITVNPSTTPTFNPVAAICSGEPLAALPTTSTNGINGTWSPALNNTATTLYTFTPTAGQCASTTTLTITVNPSTTPTFNPVAAICSGGVLAPLPTTSTNGINGTWSPALNNTATTLYTFTPTAGQCASSTTLTITVNPLDNANFSYSAGSFCTTDPNPSPTITGLAGGTFTISGAGSINATTGEVSIPLSGLGTFIVTYTTNGACPTSSTFDVTFTTGADATIAAAGPFCADATPINLVGVSAGGNWTGTGITNAVTGTFDPSVAGAGSHIITYTIGGGCGDVDTETITVNAIDNSAFNYAVGSFCTSDPNPTPTITGLGGGTFTISGAGSINAATGEVNLALSGLGTFTVTYTTNGACPTSSTFDVTITNGADATIVAAGPFCADATPINLVGASAGGTWTGTGITDGVLGTFDPSVAGAGNHIITYTIGGGCGDVDTETITVNAIDNSAFSYSAGSFCTTDPNPIPSITGLAGGTFTITGAGSINATTGAVNIPLSGLGTFTVTYTTNGACPTSSTFDITITNGADATIVAAGPFCADATPINLVGASAGGTWTGTGITDGVLGTFDPSVAGAGNHIITYTIGGGCGDVDTETITVNAVGNASFTYASAGFCLADANPSPVITGTLGGTFTISGSGVINPVSGVVNIASSGIGSFTVTYTTGGPCPASETFDIAISSAGNATITSAGPFCANDPAINLTAATAGGTWSGPGITNPATGAFNPGAAGPGSHVITYTLAGVCGASDTETIIVNAVDVATIFYTELTYCANTVDPFPTVVGTSGGTFTINNGGTINSLTGIIDLSVSGAGTYTITYTTNGLCPTSGTTDLTINPGVEVEIEPAGPFCLGEGEVFLIGTPDSGVWQGTGIMDTLIGIFNVDTAGVGLHEIIYTTDGLCGDADTIFIIVSDQPVAESSDNTIIFIGDQIELNASGGSSYFWYPDEDISCIDCQDPIVNPYNTTTYCVIVTNQYGCADTACTVVNVDRNCGQLFVPNAFSPNDIGDNNLECVLGRCVVTMTFTIYDRWGEKVFETNDQEMCWDGTFRGKPMNTGVYVYILEATLLTGEKVEQKGNISLIR